MNLLKLKNELFNNDTFGDWGKYMRLVQSNDYRNEVAKLLYNLELKIQDDSLIDDQISRQFIGAFAMIKFNMFNKNSTKDVQLYYKAIFLLKSFDLCCENLDNTKIIKEFFKNLKDYLDTFKKWKERDEKDLVDKICTQQYKEIQVMEEKFREGNTPGEQQLSKSVSMLKRKFETKIKQIGGDKIMQYINDSPKLKPIDVMNLDMEENMKKAFWDMFEDDVNNNNLKPIGENLDEFRKYLFELLGNGKKATEIKKQFDQQLEIDLIKQMILVNAITSEEIYGIIKTLTFYVKKYIHSASEDKDTEIFINNVYLKMEEQKEKLGTILRYFFQNIFEKLDKTKVKINLLNNFSI